jgi:mannosyltransferase
MRPMSEALPVLTGRIRTVVGIAVVAVVALGIILRFYTHSALWLDEALTVNRSRLPISQIAGSVKQDGAPPLYYYLLHFWMRLFGQSDEATRSLSGVIGVLTLPVAWLAGNRFGGRVVAWTTLVLLASAPFAVYYSTEARMYGLVIFLTGCGFLALSRALEAPRPGNLIAIAVVTAALLYTQYWSLYLVGVVGLWLLVTGLVSRHRRAAAAAEAA